ncbi:PRC-barrel domain-containing protein [Iamia sp.]|uniref:PRC-barrel domain-containing protein n=1 Tax=Iamia sp. TaxID=2722710 RepID=UPI002B91502D|nr:PRC-barrel domain-containing protein [Iamia sp.]HXH58673.1 PRC-barrel domain-containing protein [Iamia sp.]
MGSRPASDDELNETELNETSAPAPAKPPASTPQPGPGRYEEAETDPGSVLKLVRASHLTGLPIVTLSGEHGLEIKDVVFDKRAGGITGFTMRKPGLLGGPQKQVLMVADVHAIGPDAVMVPSRGVFAAPDSLSGSGDNVLGDRVITDDGTDLGEVTDVIASVTAGHADIVGFEVKASEALGTEGAQVFLPLPAALAISGEAIVVPASARDFVSEDYTGFGASVEAFREQLGASS